MRFTGAGTPTSAGGGYVYMRNRWYDPQTGRFLSQDPIGLAGGVNLYAYAGNNPANYSDPFGLCSGGDTLTIKVTAYCPGSTTPIEVEVKAVRVTDQAQLGQLTKVAGGLKGGNSVYTASAVSAAVQTASNSGEVYVFPSKTADGADVATGGEADGNRLRFRSDVWDNIQKGSHFMNRRTNSRFQGTACGVLGHEGVHLVQNANGRSNGDPLNEPEAARTNSTWTCH